MHVALALFLCDGSRHSEIAARFFKCPKALPVLDFVGNIDKNVS